MPDRRRPPAPRPSAGFAYQGRKGLVTGASSGLGETFARELAGRGMHLFLTALPQDETRLSEVAEDLRGTHGIHVEQLLIDLTEPGAARQLQARADERGFEPDLLVNNAGMGLLGPFVDIPLESQITMIRLNVEALVSLTGLYLPRMVSRRDGAILNISSTAAFDPLPYMAVYAASKAFVLSFSEALWAESHRAGVRVIAFCPGPMVGTRFATHGEPESDAGPRFSPGMAPTAAVATALGALERNQPVVSRRVPVLAQLYSVTMFVGHLLPRRVLLLLSERLLRWHFRLR